MPSQRDIPVPSTSAHPGGSPEKARAYRTEEARSSSDFNRYRVLCALDQGGMADVQLAIQQGAAGIKKLVVLKRARQKLASDEQFVAMLLDEARLAVRMSHPNVVQTHEVGFDGTGYFLAMEFLQGQSFRAALNKIGDGAFDFAQGVRILIATLDGLEYAHNLKDFDGRPLRVVHRDISPSNVFLTYDGQVKILDFGIAKAIDSSSETRVGVLKGKMRYMAPEQALCKGVDGRADLYAVGVMLWELAAGCRRWRGVPDLVILRRLPEEDPIAPGAKERGLPPLVDEVCLRALAKEPDQRFQTAAEFRQALEQVLNQLDEQPTLRDVGQYVYGHFVEEAEQLQRLIRSRLEALESGGDPAEELDDLPGLGTSGSQSFVTVVTRPTLSRPGEETTGVTKPLPAFTPMLPVPALPPPLPARPVPPPTLPKSPTAHPTSKRTEEDETLLQFAPEAQLLVASRQKSLIRWAVGALVLGLGSAAAIGLTSQSSESAQGDTAVVEQVPLHIAVHPLEAVVTLDGELLPSNPHRMELPRGSKVTVHAEAPGFVSRSRDLSVDAATMLEWTLEAAQPDANVAEAPSPEQSPDNAADKTSASKPRETARVASKPKVRKTPTKTTSSNTTTSTSPKRLQFDREDPFGSSR